MGKLEDKKVFIDNIVESTLSGDLKWTLDKSLFNNYKRQKYKLELSKTLNLTFEVNLDIPDQPFYLHEKGDIVDTFNFSKYSKPKYDHLESVSNFLRNDFLINAKRDIPSYEKDDFYNNLSKNFTKKSFRKNKLENILSDTPSSTKIKSSEIESNSTYTSGNDSSKSETLSKAKVIISDDDQDTSIKKLEDDIYWVLCIPILGILHYSLLDVVENKYKPVIYSYFLLQIAFIISFIIR